MSDSRVSNSYDSGAGKGSSPNIGRIIMGVCLLLTAITFTLLGYGNTFIGYIGDSGAGTLCCATPFLLIFYFFSVYIIYEGVIGFIKNSENIIDGLKSNIPIYIPLIAIIFIEIIVIIVKTFLLLVQPIHLTAIFFSFMALLILTYIVLIVNIALQPYFRNKSGRS